MLLLMIFRNFRAPFMEYSAFDSETSATLSHRYKNVFSGIFEFRYEDLYIVIILLIIINI